MPWKLGFFPICFVSVLFLLFSTYYLNISFYLAWFSSLVIRNIWRCWDALLGSSADTSPAISWVSGTHTQQKNGTNTNKTKAAPVFYYHWLTKPRYTRRFFLLFHLLLILICSSSALSPSHSYHNLIFFPGLFFYECFGSFFLNWIDVLLHYIFQGFIYRSFSVLSCL